MRAIVLVIDPDPIARARYRAALADGDWQLVVPDRVDSVRMPGEGVDVLIGSGVLHAASGHTEVLPHTAVGSHLRARVAASLEGTGGGRRPSAGPAGGGTLIDLTGADSPQPAVALGDGAGPLRCVFHEVVPVGGGPAVGYEALTRFVDGTDPQEGFRSADRRGWGVDLELHAIGAQLRAARDLPPDRWVAVNVSPRAVADARLADLLERVERPVVLEVTEHHPIDDYDAICRHVAALPGPPRVSIDDAGSGYASLAHVLALRPSFVKLDRSWITGIAGDLALQALVAGVRGFVTAIGAQLIAEGVETDADHAELAELGVDLVQGYLISRPARAEALRSA